MDYGMGLISALLTLVIFLPFFYAALLGKKQTKKIREQFENEIVRGGYRLDYKDFWGNTLIGLDKTKSKLIYLRLNKNELIRKEISMKTIKGCTVSTQEVNQRINGELITYRKSVDLELMLHGQKEIQLNFFDCNGYCKEDYDIKRAEKWKELILGYTVPSRPFRAAA
ncbi:hypothetical protein [Allomuricauda sp. M10]|uniref:hypothetical protein n=1 Tax=Allomuricauda sp. M10 TaxID=2683292 RepID=UPI001D1901B8|nr:hypothetical protein [Muricauda sp. M10]